ncbi:MAG: hypothetical protein AAFW68_14135, partial [Pseudomonadota bacterium]
MNDGKDGGNDGRKNGKEHETGPSGPVASLKGDLLTRKPFRPDNADFEGANDEAMAIRLATLE